ncbi:MAG TPA: PASTA domain-containing protein [Candidatus Methylomirabilis sp.]|nr:PASTA domain-containing protein [Candidatus Methylomirabilis sp.]
MPGIFISYRRDDAAGHAGRLFDRLSQHFGRSRVFMDVAGIEAGVDFVEAIERAVGSCQVLLVMIGRQWLAATDERGRRRLDDPHDFHRLEVSTALSRNIRVIPILVEGTRMPVAADLPEALARLARRQAVELRDSRWDADVQDLIGALDKALAPAAPLAREPDTTDSAAAPPRDVVHTQVIHGVRTPDSSAPPPSPAPPSPRRRRLLVLGGLGTLAVAVLAWALLLRSPQPGSVVVPEVAGKPLPEAEAILAKAGFKVRDVQEEEAPNAAPQTVLRQDPQPGAQVTGDAPAVALVVAKRPSPPPDIVMPDVVGTLLDPAVDTLKRAGLAPDARPGEPDRARPTYQVLNQEPKAGAKVRRGARVVVIFNPERKLTVPDVVGKSLAEARELLAKAGFGVGEVQREPSDSAKPETVLSQSPEGGTDLLEKAAFPVSLRVAVAKTTPAASAGTVVVYYFSPVGRSATEVGSEMERANGLAAYLRQGRFRADAVATEKEIRQGEVVYFAPADADQAVAMAKRSLYWLSRNGKHDVRLEPRYVEPSRVGRGAPGQFEVYLPGRPAGQFSIKGKGELRIPQTYTVDLDDGLVTRSGADLWFEARTATQRYLTARGGASLAPSPQPRPSFEGCVGAKYGLSPVPVERLVQGAAYCVWTNGGRYAAFIVLQPVGPSPGTLQISYITWETR